MQTTLAERLKKAMEGPPRVTGRALAEACSVKPPSVSDWLSGKSKTMEGGNLLAAAEFLGVRAKWLAEGTGPMKDQAGKPRLAQKINQFQIDEDRHKKVGTVQEAQVRLLSLSNQPAVDVDRAEIRQYDIAGAMGIGGLVLEEQPPGVIKAWSVDREWLRLNLPAHTGLSNLCIVTGFGPSMQPKYNPGDPLLMDSGVTEVKTDGVYFFRIGEHGFIKQLQRIPTANGLVIRAKSLNPTYDPFDITGGMDFHVLGKILMVWRSEQI